MRFSSSERRQAVTMMTLVEINCGDGMKYLFCTMDVSPPPLNSPPHVQLLYSRLPPIPHPITLYVLRISHSPEAEQAPPLATAVRLVALSEVI